MDNQKKIETVADLLSALQAFPPETKVGGIGHFGEFLELEEINLRKTYNRETFAQRRERAERKTPQSGFPIVEICIEYAGPEPD